LRRRRRNLLRWSLGRWNFLVNAWRRNELSLYLLI
jgi:hypothetical protein